MRITFVLPRPVREPIGGYIVVYEYADRLANRGHQVTVCHAIRNIHLKYKTPYIIRRIGHTILKSHKPKWFNFHNKIKLLLIPEVADKYIPEADAIIATWWATAQPVNELDENKGSKFYLIQHYETWGGNKDLVEQSYCLGLRNIVIAKWLQDKLEKVGAPVTSYIPNGIDFDTFRILMPSEKRNPLSIAMMYHEAEWKGTKEGFAALEIVRESFPALKVTFFGVFQKPEWLPKWIEFIHNPAKDQLVKIYNSHAVFISPSWSEGFGLPGAEAMACGCALVTTDSGGVRDYAVHGVTALISPPKEIKELSRNVLTLMQDIQQRIDLANRGYQAIQEFNWDKSLDKLEKELIKG